MFYEQQRFTGIKICDFTSFGAILEIKMFLVIFDFEHTYIKKCCYASGVECKSCEVSNQMFLTVIFSFLKRRWTDKLVMKYCKIKLFSGTIFHGASKEPAAYLQPSQTIARKQFCKNNG